MRTLTFVDGYEPMLYNLLDDSTPFCLPEQEDNTKISDASWSVQKSTELYHVDGWGAPYFFINEKGNIAVLPQGKKTEKGMEIDLVSVVDHALKQKGMTLPLIIRFPEILKHRLETLQGSFDRAIFMHGFGGSFQGVYPVKCNPDRYLVEDLVHFGRNFSFGLEAGSKPELLMAMSCMCKASYESLLICNGYKDSEYIKLALIARQMGIKSVIVLEQEEEVEIVLRMSQIMNVRPVIGIRAKLSTKHDGHWGETSGEKGKFGLTTVEIVRIFHRLRKMGMADCLQLLHFHIGSQIPSLDLVKEGVSEAAHLYCELSLMGANMNYLDIGGGLGIDYDGSGSAASDMSVGYSVEQYADQVIEAIECACSCKKMMSRPIVCCESGRGLVSHHSIVIFDVVSSSNLPFDTQGKDEDEDEESFCLPRECDLPSDLLDVYSALAGFVRSRTYDAALDCATSLKNECTRLFKLGLLGLELRASVDKIHAMLSAVMQDQEKEKLRHQILPMKIRSGMNLGPKIDQPVTYHINLSIFKSMPDYWAIGQLFPIVPIHRLSEKPDRTATFSDLTCDSDGKIGAFIAGDPYGKAMSSLPVHKLEEKRPYLMGMFLGGAYQEVLGSMHNLFGSAHAVHVVSNMDGGFQVTRQVAGQSVANVLRLMHHEPTGMLDALRGRLVDTLQKGEFSAEDAKAILRALTTSFLSYPYLYDDTRQSSVLPGLTPTYCIS